MYHNYTQAVVYWVSHLKDSMKWFSPRFRLWLLQYVEFSLIRSHLTNRFNWLVRKNLSNSAAVFTFQLYIYFWRSSKDCSESYWSEILQIQQWDNATLELKDKKHWLVFNSAPAVANKVILILWADNESELICFLENGETLVEAFEGSCQNKRTGPITHKTWP